jgi:hypothetical protein
MTNAHEKFPCRSLSTADRFPEARAPHGLQSFDIKSVTGDFAAARPSFSLL